MLIPILNNNKTNEKECFLPITGGLSEFIVCPICLPNNEVWYKYLGRQGYRSPKKNIVLKSTVEKIRLKNNILRKKYQPLSLEVPGYLTISQVAKILKVSRHWLYDRINNGKIKVQKDNSKPNCKYLFEDKPETIRMLMDFKNGKLNIINFL